MLCSASLRSLKFEDVPSLLPLMEELGYPISLQEMQARTLLYKKDRHKKVFVALLHKKVVGCIALSLMDYFHAKRCSCRIVALIVKKEVRRQKIGSLLLQKAESFAQKRGCSLIELTTGAHRKKMGSHDFYEKMGYHNKEEKLYLRKHL